GEEPAGFQHCAQPRLVIGEGAADAMTHGTGLTRQPTTGDRASDIVLVLPAGRLERLVDEHAQHGTREIDLPVAAIDDDVAGAGLDPDPGDSILAPSRGIGAALGVELGLPFLGWLRRAGQVLEVGKRLGLLSHGITPCVCSWG